MMTKDRLPPSASDDSATASTLFGQAFANLNEAQAYAAHYISAQLDRAKLVFRNILILTVLAVLGGAAAGTVVVMAAVLFCVGIADGLGQLLGRLWLGELLTSVLIFGVMIIAAWVIVSKIAKTSRKQIVGSYEKRESRQRIQFGADVHERSEH